MDAPDADLSSEQERVGALYHRLDELIALNVQRLRDVQRTNFGSTHQNRSERDAFAAQYQNRIAQLESVGHKLVFGRLDQVNDVIHYIGRIGLTGDDGQQQLVDWRAPAAAPFYQATAAAPLGVLRRRHITTRGRTVTDIEDDVFDATMLAEAKNIHGEGALLQALNAQRSGRMGDIVATIQSEQDKIIRASTRGVLVVQGGPGTGKTAVALHRAAYLLYAQRDHLASSGVLMIGPNNAFLKYIEKVLPSLGETGVVMATPGSLMPGVEATAHDSPRAAEIKGSFAMVRILRQAVADRQKVPAAPQILKLDDGTRLTLHPHEVAAARSQARSTNKPHNLARVVFVREMLQRLVRQWEEKLRSEGVTVSPEDRNGYIEDLRTTRDVRVALNLLWMPLAPVTMLHSLLSKRHYLESATRHQKRNDITGVLLRPANAPLTVEDVPLLDELAELLGVDDEAERHAARQAASESAALVEYAENVVNNHDLQGQVTPEMLAAHVTSTAGARFETAADRAAADRTWVYGHVVVDEAQELSTMAWRMLFRRCPSKSFTIVGDIAQTSSAAGARSWASMLHHYVQDRFTVENLTVNYRTPRQISDTADALLRAHRIRVKSPLAVREGRWPAHFTAVPIEDAATAPYAALATGVTAAIARCRELAGGKIAVICTADYAKALSEPLRVVCGDSLGVGAQGLDREVALLTPEDAKGLEFDAVIVVEPSAMVRASQRGINDLYVAMTRPTQMLEIVHAAPLPQGL